MPFKKWLGQQAIIIKMNHFHNTINAVNPELSVYDGKCKDQEIVILAFFDKYPYQDFTPFEIMQHLKLYNTPIQSIRRAITNLTTDGKLEMTDNMRMGIYGKKNYCWKRKVTKGQQSIF